MRIDSPAALAEYAAALKARKHAPVKLLVSMGTCGIAAGTGEVRRASTRPSSCSFPWERAVSPPVPAKS